jgi:hypothetical protein
VRNVIEEMERRLGDDWLVKTGGGVVEVSSTLGAGLWAVMDAQGLLEEGGADEIKFQVGEYQLVHASRYGMELAQKLAKGAWHLSVSPATPQLTVQRLAFRIRIDFIQAQALA